MKLKPKNWVEFQHYKNRNPPWIKFHRNILNDRDFMSLPLASKALAPLLWLLASEEQDGVFDASSEELQFRLRLTPKEIEQGIKPLIDKGLFVVASKALAEGLQVASKSCSETEREAETERETETEREKKVTVQRFTPPTVSQVAEFCKERGNGINAEKFVDYYAAQGWVLKNGNKMKDWKAAVRNWEKNSTNKINNDPFAGAI